MGEDTASWDATVQEYLLDSGKVCAGGVACIADGCRFFGAATDEPNHPDGPWAPICKTGYKISISQEDGSTIEADCDEGETIRQAVEDGRAPHGVYLGGNKYTMAELKKDFEYNSQVYDVAVISKPKGGGFLIKTPNGNVAVAIYDEEKGHIKSQALDAALVFADYLNGGGF